MKKIIILIIYASTILCNAAAREHASTNGHSAAPPAEERRSIPSLAPPIDKPTRVSRAQEDPPITNPEYAHPYYVRGGLGPSRAAHQGLDILLPPIPEYDSSNDNGE